MCNIWIAIFWLLWLIFGQKIASHTCRSRFLHKWIVHEKISAQNSKFDQKWLQRHLEAKQDSKKVHLRPAQECSKVPKICFYFWAFSLIVSDRFKPTVECKNLTMYSGILEILYRKMGDRGWLGSWKMKLRGFEP